MQGLDIPEVEAILEQLDSEKRIFPQYQLYKDNGRPVLLGRGGFSCVYEMVSRNDPEKHYAMKVMGFDKHTITSEAFHCMTDLQRTLSEQNESVARIIDSLEITLPIEEKGHRQIQFILMEKLEPVLKKDRFGKVALALAALETEEGVAEFALQIGEAIQTAHCNRVLHRDIKLENIFYHPQTGKYVLGDFGIAKFVENGTAETMVYTDGYGAPEIERCLAEQYSATADIYSFGVTLYLLLNELCFPASEGYRVNPVQYSPDFVFPAPKNAGADFAGIVQKMCCYDSEDRYESMETALADVKRMMSREEPADENTFYPDLETETYKESIKKNKTKKGTRKIQKTRMFRKEEKRLAEKDYRIISVVSGIGIALLVMLLIKSVGMETKSVTSPLFWLMPIALAVQALLVRIKEFQWIFGILSVGLTVYSALSLGCGVVHVVVCLAILSGLPLVMAASAGGVFLWMLWAVYGIIPEVALFEHSNIGWIPAALLLLLINGYIWQGWYYDKRSDRVVDCWDILYRAIYHILLLVGIVVGLLQLTGVVQMPEWWNRIHPGLIGLVLKTVAAIEPLIDGIRAKIMHAEDGKVINEEEEEAV